MEVVESGSKNIEVAVMRTRPGRSVYRNGTSSATIQMGLDHQRIRQSLEEIGVTKTPEEYPKKYRTMKPKKVEE